MIQLVRLHAVFTGDQGLVPDPISDFSQAPVPLASRHPASLGSVGTEFTYAQMHTHTHTLNYFLIII